MLKREWRKKHSLLRLAAAVFGSLMLGLVCFSVYEFYQDAVNEKMKDLETLVSSQAVWIDEINRHTKNNEITLKMLERAHVKIVNKKTQGKLVISMRHGDHLDVIQRKSNVEKQLIHLSELNGDERYPVSQALLGKQGGFQGKNYQGEEVIGYYQYVDSIDMGLVSEVSLSEMRGHFVWLILRLLIIGLILAAIALYTYRYFERQYYGSEIDHRKKVRDTLRVLKAFKDGMDRHSMVSITDSDGRFIHTNKRFCTVTGYTQDELLFNKYSMLKSGEHDNEFYQNMWKTISSEKTWHGQIKNRRKNGDYFWVDTSIIPTRKLEEDKVSFICIQTDVTEKRQLLKNLEKERQKAISASERKTTFLAQMSHEIRTPLSSIIGYSDLIANDNNLGRNSSGYINVVKKNSQHLVNLIGEILDFSKIEAGQLEIRKEKVELLEFLNRIRRLYVNQSENVRFSVDVNTPIPKTVETDALRLQQILINLIGNAFKFTENGSILMSVRLADRELDGVADKLVIEVEDTGSGIDSGDRKSVFKPFVQSNNYYTRTKGGTGLGLALAKEMAQLLGGDLKLVKSKVGIGSKFMFYVDFKSEEPIEMLNEIPYEYRLSNITNIDAYNPINKISLKNIKVLVVEDSLDISELIRLNLEGAGAEVRVINNGIDAVRQMKIGIYDIVLLDLQLPRMSGHEVLRDVRKILPQLPVFALTAHSTKTEKDLCMAHGFDEFMTKPINFSLLIKRISNFLKDNEKVEINIGDTAEEEMGPIFSAFAETPAIQANLASFVSSMHKKVDRVVDMADKQDWDTLKFYCHQIKGAYSTYGYPELYELAKQIEILCKSSLGDSERSKEIEFLVHEIRELSLRAQKAI